MSDFIKDVFSFIYLEILEHIYDVMGHDRDEWKLQDH